MARAGVCVGCIKTELRCKHPTIEGTNRCGRDRSDLPDTLYVSAQEQGGAAVDVLERLKRAAVELEEWEKTIVDEAAQAGLDEAALRFIKEKLSG